MLSVVIPAELSDLVPLTLLYSDFGQSVELLQSRTLSHESDEEGSSLGSTLKSNVTEKVIDMNKRDPLTGGLEISEKVKLIQLLGRWEEPDRTSTGSVSCF